jgi:rfaE bifunctional protein nucleotidyltransferase chain/domain
MIHPPKTSFDLLAQQAHDWQKERQVIVLCHGCFDIFHIGHLLYLQEAKSFGDKLIVTITPDHYVNKGPGRPVFPAHQRRAVIDALSCVDATAINLWDSALNTILSIRPDLFVKGPDYRDLENCNPNILEEKEAVESIGGKLVFTNGQLFSSTEIINKLDKL